MWLSSTDASRTSDRVNTLSLFTNTLLVDCIKRNYDLSVKCLPNMFNITIMVFYCFKTTDMLIIYDAVVLIDMYDATL